MMTYHRRIKIISKGLLALLAVSGINSITQQPSANATSRACIVDTQFPPGEALVLSSGEYGAHTPTIIGAVSPGVPKRDLGNSANCAPSNVSSSDIPLAGAAIDPRSGMGLAMTDSMMYWDRIDQWIEPGLIYIDSDGDIADSNIKVVAPERFPSGDRQLRTAFAIPYAGAFSPDGSYHMLGYTIDSGYRPYELFVEEITPWVGTIDPSSGSQSWAKMIWGDSCSPVISEHKNTYHQSQVGSIGSIWDWDYDPTTKGLVAISNTSIPYRVDFSLGTANITCSPITSDVAPGKIVGLSNFQSWVYAVSEQGDTFVLSKSMLTRVQSLGVSGNLGSRPSVAAPITSISTQYSTGASNTDTQQRISIVNTGNVDIHNAKVHAVNSQLTCSPIPDPFPPSATIDCIVSILNRSIGTSIIATGKDISGMEVKSGVRGDPLDKNPLPSPSDSTSVATTEIRAVTTTTTTEIRAVATTTPTQSVGPIDAPISPTNTTTTAGIPLTGTSSPIPPTGIKTKWSILGAVLILLGMIILKSSKYPKN